MLVRELMTSPVVTLREDDRISSAAKLMEKYRIGSIVVVDEDHRAIGIVTDRDIVCRGLAYDLELDEPVSEIMTERLYVVFEDDDVAVATYFMGAKQVKRIIVVDEDYALKGLISLGDIARTEYNEFGTEEALERISYPYTDYISNPHYGVEVDDFRL